MVIQVDLRRLVVVFVLVAGGAVAGAALCTSNQAHGEIRATPPPQSFQTGGQMSVPILKEISATLGQIDARLARLEAIAQRIQTQQAAGSAGPR